MKKWEFFDNLHEPVYVADIENHELVYMNKWAMEWYGFSSRQEYLGKKCYSVLQGCNSPCTMCTNKELKPGEFVEWQYYNPKVNKYFLLKDSLIEEEGRKYRIEVAIDITEQKRQGDRLRNYQDLETIVNNGIRISLNEPVPDRSLNIILEYIGMALNGERTYIFERTEELYDNNTYEWAAAGITPEKDNLQNLPPEVCANWYRNFSEGKNIVIEDLEEIRESEPVQYEIMKRQNIRSVGVVPLYLDGRVLGFFGIDNPPPDKLEYATNMLQTMGYFIVSTLKRRNLVKELKDMSYSDQLTGLGNRRAMEEYSERMSLSGSVGVVYCDITGLKRLNDDKGHSSGDKLIRDCGDCLKTAFGGCGVFRIGGDELLALCSGISRQAMDEKTALLHRSLADRGLTMAAGAVWQEKTEDIRPLIKEAERLMYAEKSEYYRKMGLDRRKY